MNKPKIGDMLGGDIFHSKKGTTNEKREHTPRNSPKSFMKGIPKCW